MSAIIWTERESFGSKFGEWGWLGKVCVWAVFYGTGRQPTPYVLTCALPGIKDRVEVESVEAGKARAERQLDAFLKNTNLARHTEEARP